MGKVLILTLRSGLCVRPSDFLDFLEMLGAGVWQVL